MTQPLDMPDDPFPQPRQQFHRVEKVRARKFHTCTECGNQIVPGMIYVKETASPWDSDWKESDETPRWYTGKYHQDCFYW